MILKKISLNRFKKFQSLELSLLRGLNVIKGPNEAGKSTLHAAVIAGLFFNPSHRRAEIKNNISWNSEKMYEINLIIEEDMKEYEISKDFENRRIQIAETQSETKIMDSSKMNQKLFDWLGFTSARLFRSTVCIEQDKISQVTKGDKEIGDILKSTITGEDDAAASYVLMNLKTALDQSPKGEANQNKYTSIKNLSRRIKESEEEKTYMKADIKKASNLNARLLDIEETLIRINSELKTKRNLKVKNERRRELKTDLDVLEEKLEHERNCLKLDLEIQKLEDRLTVYQPFFNLTDEDIEQFHSLLGNKESFEELQKSLEEQLKHPHQKVVQKRPKLNQFFIAGLILLWIGLIAAIITKYMLILAFAGLLSLCTGLVIMISKSEVQIELSPDQIRNQINHASDQLNFVNESIKYFLSRTKCTAAHEFIAKLEGYRPLKKRKIEKDAELSGMIGNQAIAEIKNSANELASGIKGAKQELSTLDAFALDPEAYQRLLDEVEKLAQEKSELEEESKQLRIVASNLQSNEEDLAFIEENLAELKNHLEFEQERSKIIKKCFNYLKMAREKTLRSATEVLQQEIEKYLSAITHDRYQKVNVDADTLNISVYAPEKGDFVDIQKLSRATIDQIYLAARLGLVKLVSGNKKPPLLLDDPFIAFDDNRLETTMELLLEVAKEYQILLFTCSNRYDQYADKVIDLRTYSVLGDGSPGPKKEDPEIEPAFLNNPSPLEKPSQDIQQ